MSATIFKITSKSIIKRMDQVWRWVVLIAVVLAMTANPYTSQPTQAQSSRPNIVLIISDDQNVDSLPVMRKLLSYPEGNWVNFKNAFVSNSICCPSRASMLTGQYSFRTGVVSNSTGDKLNDRNTLAVWLDQAGYRNGMLGKYLNQYPWDKGAGYVPPGWDYFKTSGLGGNADGFTNEAVNFINNSSSPFFLYVSYWDPHAPARPMSRYASANVYVPPNPPNFNEPSVKDKPLWVRELPVLSQSTMDQWRAERIASQRSLLGVDDSIQSIVNALKAKGVLENTMIIFLGDNGFSWGSHRWTKKACVYEECIRVPLLIRYPGLGHNREETRFVSNIDLATTMAEFARVTPGLPQDGRSLIPVITNTATDWREEVFLEVHSWTNKMTFSGIRVPGWVYAEYANGDKELYDLATDPYQLHNIAYNRAYRPRRDQLAQRMRELKGN